MKRLNQSNAVVGFLDGDHHPAIDIITSNGWCTRISPDFPLPEQIEWICLKNDGSSRDEVIVFCFDGPDIVGPMQIRAAPEDVMRLLVKYAYATVLIQLETDLFFLKDSSDRFCIYFGTEAKVANAYRLSPRDANQGFLEWVEDARLDNSERAALLRIFERYKAA